MRAYEQEREQTRGLGWPMRLMVGLGVLLLGAGVLLFVAAHWDQLSPWQRFGLVLTLVAFFHITGAVLASRAPFLALGLHCVGTISLGAAVFMTAQIFHLQEHWAGGIMLWAVGAAAAWALLRDWPHAALTALLVPAWIGGEWVEATRGWEGGERILTAGIVMLAVTYLTARIGADERPVRRALVWIGGIALIPATALLIYNTDFFPELPAGYWWSGSLGALALPLLLAWWLRGAAVWINVVAAGWVAVVFLNGLYANGLGSPGYFHGPGLVAYGLCGAGAVGLIVWGVAEARRERINLGVAGFGLTLFAFYFSNVMDRLGRSASLVGLGLLFLLGGWLLERARRRLVARVEDA